MGEEDSWCEGETGGRGEGGGKEGKKYYLLNYTFCFPSAQLSKWHLLEKLKKANY
jgi:hypothetical protein